MKVGDLVSVVQTIGCYTPPRFFRPRGLGIVVKIDKTDPVTFSPEIRDINLGDEITVALASGEIEKFCEQSVAAVL